MSEEFARLRTPRARGDAEVYATSYVPDYPHFRVAKATSGDPALLISVVEGRGGRPLPPPVGLKYLSVTHNVECIIHRADGLNEAGVFTVVRCAGSDESLVEYFFWVAEALLYEAGENPSTDAIDRIVALFAELFRSMSAAPRKAVQGLWSELLVILAASDPGVLIDTWHAGVDDLHDFSWQGQRLEVKSATGESRVHQFSLAQLVPWRDSQLIVGSVLVARVARGCTVSDLIDEIRSKLGGQPERTYKLLRLTSAILGSDWHKQETEAFDFEYSRNHIAYFRGTDVPCVSTDLPPGVSEVRFQANLNGITPISAPELRRSGGILGKLGTRPRLNRSLER